MEEEHMYSPKELIFALMKGDPDVGIDAYVAFTTKECWDENRCCSDDLGGHNMPGEILNECGVADGEFMESMFELTGEYPLEKVGELLKQKGFEENPDFTKFMQAHSE